MFGRGVGVRTGLVMLIASLGCVAAPAGAQSWEESRDYYLNQKRNDLNQLCTAARQLNGRGQQFWTADTRTMIRNGIAKDAASAGVNLPPERFDAFERGMEAAMQVACPDVH